MLMLQILRHRFHHRFHVPACLLAKGSAQLAGKMCDLGLHFRVLVLACTAEHVADGAEAKVELLRVGLEADVQEFDQLNSNFFGLLCIRQL